MVWESGSSTVPLMVRSVDYDPERTRLATDARLQSSQRAAAGKQTAATATAWSALPWSRLGDPGTPIMHRCSTCRPTGAGPVNNPIHRRQMASPTAASRPGVAFLYTERLSRHHI